MIAIYRFLYGGTIFNDCHSYIGSNGWKQFPFPTNQSLEEMSNDDMDGGGVRQNWHPLTQGGVGG